MKNFICIISTSIILFSACGRKPPDKEIEPKQMRENISEEEAIFSIPRHIIDTLHIELGKVVNKNLVLTSAIRNNGGNAYIFIQKEGHKAVPHQHSDNETKEVQEEYGDNITFQLIQVKRGVTNNSFTEITALQPISDTAKVVTSGAFYLMAFLTAPQEDKQ